MFNRRMFATFVIVLVFSLSACNLRWNTPLISGATGTPPVNEQTIIAEAARQTLTAVVPALPTSTFTPRFTFTPSIPTLTVSVETNCRTGPGAAYDKLGVMLPGQTADVVGRNTSGDTWVIKLPSNPAITCWLWGYYATITGNTSAVPILTPPPTPTPIPDFSYEYYWWGVGPGFECMMYTVSNTGGETWRSYSLTFENQTDGGTWVTISDTFVKYDGWCAPIETQTDLAPGEVGTVSVTTHMLSSHSGDTLKAVLTLCSGDGLTGVCITRTLTHIG